MDCPDTEHLEIDIDVTGVDWNVVAKIATTLGAIAAALALT